MKMVPAYFHPPS